MERPNDYRPVALTPVVIKCFERLVCQQIRTSIWPEILVQQPGCSSVDRKALQRVINTAQKITGWSLRSLDAISNSRCLSRAGNIIKDSSHPSNHLFELLPSSQRFRSSKTRMNRLRNSFFPRAITAVNSHRACWTSIPLHPHKYWLHWSACNNIAL